jgi:hypothetical protein
VDRKQLAQNIELQSMHSYSVLGIFETNKVQLLQIRNPLGFFGKGVEFPDLSYNYKDSFWKTISP